MKFLSIVFTLFFLLQHNNFAQETEPVNNKAKPPISGEIGLRSFWMSTSYWEDFKGDFALGQSAYLQLKTQSYKGFSAIGRYTVFGNAWSSDLLARDPITQNFNRYEVGLFDVLNPDDRFFGKLEEFQLRYQSEKFEAAIGRMDINTPFINPQDGRLSPTFVEGIRINFKPDPKNSFSADIIGRMSPRSTSGWFDIGETIGIYPVGQSEMGMPSKYQGNTASDFFTVLDWQHHFDKGVQLQVNHTYVDNISSTYLTQAVKDWNISNSNNKLLTGLQLTFQHGIGEGGNPEPERRFKNPDDANVVISGRLGIKNPRSLLFFNYTRIDGSGRFLNPREWGRDPFFTFIPRERNEGYNQVNAFTTYYQRNLPEKGLQFYGFAGLHFLPDPANAELNKYAFPSYAQANLGSRYSPGWANGLDLHFILMSKINLKSGEMRPQWIYNKVNMIHVNLMVNYKIQWN
ncbi:hypothetical protein [Cecembia lonarensis]|uniref:Outer membrane porin, OprD family n=1 Tax=Cecembia lonarensis (strain CCUG 58316 / KCTC 22772 / LW9) TaxID=1225176 RepID=K1M4E9_CECL9|nr:hypothetical protein [Cecembia lonarensis]EKB51129.1 hypothetical protein B879_00180 [Cecembia lonarensis LW9]